MYGGMDRIAVRVSVFHADGAAVQIVWRLGSGPPNDRGRIARLLDGSLRLSSFRTKWRTTSIGWNALSVTCAKGAILKRESCAINAENPSGHQAHFVLFEVRVVGPHHIIRDLEAVFEP
jgi:hypothetical protein